MSGLHVGLHVGPTSLRSPKCIKYVRKQGLCTFCLHAADVCEMIEMCQQLLQVVSAILWFILERSRQTKRYIVKLLYHYRSLRLPYSGQGYTNDDHVPTIS